MPANYNSSIEERFRSTSKSESSKFIHYHGHLNPKILLQEITKYDFGWAGFNNATNKKHLDVTLPNKLFEYIACGLPVLSFPHRTQKKFIMDL